MRSTRRDFLKTGAMGVTLSFLSPQLLVRNAFGAAAGGKVLVVLQLAGGNDAVNTFIPYADSRYRSLRPALAIPDGQILKLDDRLGFHPSMAKLQPLYQGGKFAFINNVGFATLDRSHFRCQDVWQTGDDSYGQTQRGVLGWLGKYADLYLKDGATSLTSVSIGNRIPLGMKSSSVISAAMSDASTFQVQTDQRVPSDREPFISTVRSIYGVERTAGDLETIRDHGGDMFESIDLLETIPPPSATAVYPGTQLGRAFQLAAQIIAGEVGTHALWISTGGYDTHSQQATQHANLLTDVSDSLAAFYDDLAIRGISNRVMVMAWSEFGRRVQENASLGTDHGKAGTVFLLGDSVKGGTFYGEVPNLADLDSGDLKTEIDFRSVYSTIIRDWYGNDPLPVLNREYENLGFVQRPPSGGRRRSVRR